MKGVREGCSDVSKGGVLAFISTIITISIEIHNFCLNFIRN